MSVLSILGLLLTITIVYVVVQLAPVVIGKLIIMYASLGDHWWNCLRVKSPPGTYLRIVRGNEKGSFDGIYPSIPNYEYDEAIQKIVPVVGMQEDGYLSKLGVVAVGFNRATYKRSPRYTVSRKDKDGKLVLEPAKRDPEYELFQHTISFEETFFSEDNWPCPTVIQFAVEIWFPIQAEFIVGTWETQVESAIREILSEWFKSKTIEKIKSERDNASQNLSEIVTKSNTEKDGDPEKGLLRLTGVWIRTFRFVDLDLETGDPKVAELLRAVSEAKLRGDADVGAAEREETASRHRAQAIRNLGEAQADSYKAIRDKAGVEGLQLAGTEAFSKGIGRASTIAVGNANLGILTGTEEGKKPEKKEEKK